MPNRKKSNISRKLPLVTWTTVRNFPCCGEAGPMDMSSRASLAPESDPRAFAVRAKRYSRSHDRGPNSRHDVGGAALAEQGGADRARLVDREHDDRDAVVARQREGGS